jgi:ABC-2 type transport system ATP-binding protein
VNGHDVTVDVVDLRVVRQHHEILNSICFRAYAGELIGLLGPSGSGKSTLMRSLLGVQTITAGSVQVLGSPAGSRELRDEVGYMAQGSAIYLDLTIEENLRYFAGILHEEHSEVARAMEMVSLTPLSNRVVSTLSGGERTRVSLATALLGSPRVLILDEPTVGLDPILRRDLWHTFEELAGAGATVLVSSHVMDEAVHCARLLLLREGRALFDDSPAKLLESSSSPNYDEAFERLIEDQA